ncbi:MAG: polymer-forming cytoskeletal protein [Acidobacteriota bacterium]|nr:polymer-forming cytoskeletal protein [Acidobacteriota bacterium]
MFKDSARGDLNGFLDAGSHINGELQFEDTFRVDGTLTGKVVSEGDLVVGEQGKVDAEIHVGRLFVSGVVRGTVLASKRAEFTAGGRVYADVETPTLIVEEGAHFEGHCRMTPPGGNVHRLPVGGEKVSS